MVKKYSDAEILALIQESSAYNPKSTLSMPAIGARKPTKYLFILLFFLFAIFISLFYQEIQSFTESALIKEKKIEFVYPPFSPLIQNFDLSALHQTSLFLAEEEMAARQEEDNLLPLQEEGFDDDASDEAYENLLP